MRHAMSRFMIVSMFLCGMLAACAAPEPSLYQRLGGTEGIAAIVDEFVTNTKADPVIAKRFFGADIPRTKQFMTDLFCQEAGGPCKYTGRSLKEIHRGMTITDAEFDGMAANMRLALSQFSVPPRETREFMTMFESMRGDVVGQ